MKVTEVGDKTFYGALAGELQEEQRDTPLKIRLGELAKSISKFGYMAAGITVLAYLYNAILLDNRFNLTLILNTLTDFRTMFSYLLKSATLAVTVIVMAVPERITINDNSCAFCKYEKNA